LGQCREQLRAFPGRKHGVPRAEITVDRRVVLDEQLDGPGGLAVLVQLDDLHVRLGDRRGGVAVIVSLLFADGGADALDGIVVDLIHWPSSPMGGCLPECSWPAPSSSASSAEYSRQRQSLTRELKLLRSRCRALRSCTAARIVSEEKRTIRTLSFAG